MWKFLRRLFRRDIVVKIPFCVWEHLMSRISEVEAAVSDLKSSVELLIESKSSSSQDVGLTNAEVDATLASLKSITDKVDAALPQTPQE